MFEKLIRENYVANKKSFTTVFFISLSELFKFSSYFFFYLKDLRIGKKRDLANNISIKKKKKKHFHAYYKLSFCLFLFNNVNVFFII